jgi:carbon storage regulator
MLVLTRKRNEQIIINNNITVTVVHSDGNKVRLSIELPNGVGAHRHEFWLTLTDAEKESGLSEPDIKKEREAHGSDGES